MQRKVVRVDQFSPSISAGDGASNGMLFTRRLLRELGFAADIYAFGIDPALAGEVRPASRYVADAAALPADGERLLLVHHTLGHEHGRWLAGLGERKLLVYHNITPPEYFSPGHPVRTLSPQGRQMLVDWLQDDFFAAAIGMSAYNSAELRTLGYPAVSTLPLLVDVARCRQAPWQPALVAAHEDRFTVLFVGRLAPNKCQHELVAVMDALLGRIEQPAELVLVGGCSDLAYEAQLRREIETRGLGDYVQLRGKVSEAELFAWYRAADVFVCLSEHEGFGMPLIEAMLFDLPVIAWQSSNIGDTLGCGGLLCADKEPQQLAALIALLAREPGLRARMIAGQRENLRRFDHARLRAGLAEVLESVGAPPLAAVAETETESEERAGGVPAGSDGGWRIEGPFDRHYSLALVNREFARALIAAGEPVTLHSTEGDGDFAPAAAFLAAEPVLAAAWERGRQPGQASQAAVTTRNCYPPRVSAMAGVERWLLSYGWEESGFPRAWAQAFNRQLSGITLMSQFVRQVLENSGVRVPMAVVGLGADHVLRAAAEPDALPLRREADCFSFVHVSSGFPRKGLDALLQAWALAFAAGDGVRLVVKTFANPHNRFGEELAAWRQQHPQAAPVVHVEQELSDGALRALYELADALVGVARGEGFGLPLAEAMLLGVPVVCSAHGGQRDFCSPETAWLVDWQYAPAQSHFGVFNSVWAEPVVDDLVRQLRAVKAAPAAERAAKVAAAQALIGSKYRWQDAVARLQAARSTLAPAMLRRTPQRVALVSSWNTRCGIADYARAQAQCFAPAALRVFANVVGEDEAAAAAEVVRGDGLDGLTVTRCWQSGGADSLEALEAALTAWAPEVLLLQFNFGFFELAALERLLLRLQAQGCACHVVLHATRDVYWGEVEKSLRHAQRGLAGCRRLMVHAVDDLNRLKAMALDERAMLVGHGLPDFGAAADNPARAALRQALGFDAGALVLGSGGFLLPNKGYVALVEAFDALRAQQPALRLLLQTPEYPAEASRAYRAELEARIAASPWAQDIVLDHRFLSEAETLARLAAADRLVYPTQATGESSSASVRWGLAVDRPVAVSTAPIFADVREVVYTLPGEDAAALTIGLGKWLSEPCPYEQARRQWAAQHRWREISAQLWEVLAATLE